MKVRILSAVLVSISLLAIPAMAQDGPATFKTRCAPCHGDQGQGKPNGAPKLVGTTKDVAAVLTKGSLAKAPHIKPMNTLNAAQINAVVAYAKTLK
jgi:mono/diheme cytochrome c family protein